MGIIGYDETIEFIAYYLLLAAVALKLYYIALKHYIYAALYRFHQKSVIFDRFADLSRFPRNQNNCNVTATQLQRHSRYVDINRHCLTITHDKDPNDR